MNAYDVVVCSDCGFVYAENIPSQEVFNGYYAVMSKYEFGHSGGVVSRSYIDHSNKIADFLIPHLNDKNARILDIGCSTGSLLAAFQERGYRNLLGVDPSPACVETTARLYGITAVAGDIAGFEPQERFDLITLSAVTEHLVDLRTSMQKVISLLNDSGLLFIEVPDAERFDSYIFTPFQQFSIEHINYFTRYSIANLLSTFSLGIIEIEEGENRVNQTIDPDLFVLSKRTDDTTPIAKDLAGEQSIRRYIDKCAAFDVEIKSRIEMLLRDINKIIVWGVGTHTQRLIDSGLDLSKVLYFVDSNTRYKGKAIGGILIKSPDDIVEDVPILISTYSYQEEVVRQIRESLKLKNRTLTIYKNPSSTPYQRDE